MFSVNTSETSLGRQMALVPPPNLDTSRSLWYMCGESHNGGYWALDMRQSQILVTADRKFFFTAAALAWKISPLGSQSDDYIVRFPYRDLALD